MIFRGLARLDAGARLAPAAGLEDPSIIEFGPFSIDERERMLRRDGQAVPLTPKAVDVLLALLERPGRLITKDELVQRVWPDTFVEEANLPYNIFTLRKALGETADNPEYVETIPKRGYRFKAPVRRLNGHRGSLGGESRGPDQGSRSPAILPFPEQPTHHFEGTAALKPAPDLLASRLVARRTDRRRPLSMRYRRGQLRSRVTGGSIGEASMSISSRDNYPVMVNGLWDSRGHLS